MRERVGADLAPFFACPLLPKVLECSDDKHQNKAQRKQAQIDSAAHKSDAASESTAVSLSARPVGASGPTLISARPQSTSN